MSKKGSAPAHPDFVAAAWRDLGFLVEQLRAGAAVGPEELPRLEDALRVLSRAQAEAEALLEDAMRDVGRIPQDALPAEQLRRAGRERRRRVWAAVERWRDRHGTTELVLELEAIFLRRPPHYASWVCTLEPFKGRPIGEVPLYWLKRYAADGPPWVRPIAEREVVYRARLAGQDPADGVD